jgi:thiol:disulfide interchange protein DsbD
MTLFNGFFSKEKISENEIELKFKAQIEANWHLYSQHLPVGVDAYPTEFIFYNNKKL